MATQRICSVDGCSKPVQSRDRCESHYREFLKTAPRIRVMVRGICKALECGKPHWAHGYCRVHANDNLYQRKRTTPKETIAFIQNALTATTSECIVWPFARDKDGYGITTAPSEAGKRGRKTPAHRYMCTLRYGAPSDPALIACHKCDNPSCVNPNHLEWGTQSKNINDAVTRGRIKPGQHRRAKLTDDKVREILASDERTSVLAARYGVDSSLIDRIRKRTAWRHVQIAVG